MKTKQLAMAFLFVLCSCSMPMANPPNEVEAIEIPAMEVEVDENPVPGTVTSFWEEPMYDFVDVPAQIDPHGTYYRSRHREVQEIRHERYQVQEFPAVDNSKPESKISEPRRDADRRY